MALNKKEQIIVACSIRHSLKLGLRCDLVPPGQTWPLPLCPLSAPLHSEKMIEGHGSKVDGTLLEWLEVF